MTMFSVPIDNKKIDLIPLEDALAQSGLAASDLDPLKVGQEPAHPIWSDETFTQMVAAKLLGSILPGMPIEDFPKLPDQFGILLRSELTLVSNRYTLTSEEKDFFEQRLQNVLRPIIYEAVQAKLAAGHSERARLTIGQILSETTGLGWQKIEAGEWSVCEIDSAVGVVGYLLSNGDEFVAAQKGFNNEQLFLLKFSEQVFRSLLQN